MREQPNYRIEVKDEARRSIEHLARESSDGNETGGILLGRGPDAGGEIHVEIAGDPGPNADRRPDFFLRDLAHAQLLASRAWEERRAIWVGEWHTHPEGGVAPSPVDLATYARLLSASALEFEVFVSVIVVPDEAEGWSMPRLHPWTLAIEAIQSADG
ncbi:MAG TPA: Mov34/MPN/PAD-1 family protein [Solirubrobacterales bacterium]